MGLGTVFCTILLNHLQPAGSGLGINPRAADCKGWPVTYDLAQKNVLQPEFLSLDSGSRETGTLEMAGGMGGNGGRGMWRREPSGLGRGCFLHKRRKALESGLKFLRQFKHTDNHFVFIPYVLSHLQENASTSPYDPMGCSLPGSSVHGISQARILEWVAMSSSRGFPNPGIEPESPALQADFFTH